MKRIVRKRKKSSFFLSVILYIILIAFCCSCLFIYYFNRTLGPGLIRCAEDEMERLTILVMNNCINKYFDSNKGFDFLKISRNYSSEGDFVQYDVEMMNQMASDITDMLENDLIYMVKGDFEKIGLNLNHISDVYYEKLSDGVLFAVSVGSATGNPLLANIGPKIPLNLSVLGNVLSKIDTKVTEYGMNNALIQVFVQLEVNIVIHMPFLSETIQVENEIPLVMELVQGDLPGYYFNQ